MIKNERGAHQNARRLFGTDGVRGVAGRDPLDRQTVRRLGAALIRALPHGTRSPKILVGGDTRESGAWIEAELAHGAVGEGATVTSAGIVPTPAVAYLTRAQGYDAGVVISASHNPFEDNGIKVFSGRGEKFTERTEREVEAIVADTSWSARDGAPEPVPHIDLVGPYLDHLRAVFPESPRLGRFKLAVDCANGATTTVAPPLFDSIGLDTVVIGDQPDGRNINLGCGSTHPERLARTVVEHGCRLGVAFDGDGDRAIFVDERGEHRERRRRALHVRTSAEGRGSTQGERRRGDRDEQYWPRDRAAGERHRARPNCGRRQVRHGGDAQPRRVARRRTIGPRHFFRLPFYGRRFVHRAERAAHGRAERPFARRALAPIS